MIAWSHALDENFMLNRKISFKQDDYFQYYIISFEVTLRKYKLLSDDTKNVSKGKVSTRYKSIL